MHLELWTFPLLFFTGLLAGLVDSVAGGGGIISLPVLLNLGMPVPLALGTNKLQASFGSGTATWHYARSGLVRLRDARLGIAATFIGALGGAWAVRLLDGRAWGKMIPWLLAAVAIYVIARPRIGDEDRPARFSVPVFSVLFGLCLGFYDGFFGPGAGSFWTIAYVAGMGFNFSKATGYTKVMNFTSNLTAFAVFVFAGSVHIAAGLTMAAGQIAGARVGAGLVTTRGARFVRPLFLTMVVVTLGRLIALSLRP